jgi:predicted enzyme related to lactoylglutathione lyase
MTRLYRSLDRLTAVRPAPQLAWEAALCRSIPRAPLRGGLTRYPRLVLRQPQRYGGGHGDLVVVIDCADLERSAAFWTTTLSYVREGDPEGQYQSLIPSDGVGVELLLQRVPEVKNTKNRMHFDLRTRDLVVETARVRALGAAMLTSGPILEDGWTWHILADPDGNEFCVTQPPPEYWDEH